VRGQARLQALLGSREGEPLRVRAHDGGSRWSDREGRPAGEELALTVNVLVVFPAFSMVRRASLRGRSRLGQPAKKQTAH